ncbi:hypothetical protein I6N95_00515 [Vagococcus sp. BWB3-3]|uniref:Uncharacterized protein n=1 Tax=Vagococcus allomyrinae TaxID=2794353 RepID=A0A940SQ94_9ENTE|nr:hypothetical protein [Vagococcus allomyrinae]MBP1039477.1 hypothetical protein [Vagococcus allomyrinae]
MNLIVEMTDKLGMDYYYVRMYCEGERLMMETPDPRMKELNRCMSMRDLEKLHWQVNGNVRRLVFVYKEEGYSIVDVGAEFERVIVSKLMAQSLV